MSIKIQILSLSKNQLNLYRKSNFYHKKSNDIFNKISNFISIKNKFYLYQKSKFIFIKNRILSLSNFYSLFSINYLDFFKQTKNTNFN